MAVTQAIVFHFKCYSILHFAVCQLLCWLSCYNVHNFGSNENINTRFVLFSFASIDLQCVYVCLCLCLCVCVYVRVCVRACVRTYVYVRVRAYVCVTSLQVVLFQLFVYQFICIVDYSLITYYNVSMFIILIRVSHCLTLYKYYLLTVHIGLLYDVPQPLLCLQYVSLKTFIIRTDYRTRQFNVFIRTDYRTRQFNVFIRTDYRTRQCNVFIRTDYRTRQFNVFSSKCETFLTQTYFTITNKLTFRFLDFLTRHPFAEFAYTLLQQPFVNRRLPEQLAAAARQHEQQQLSVNMNSSSCL